MKLNFEMTCKQMRCKLSYKACMSRQERTVNHGRWGKFGVGVMTDECLGCKQGAAVMKKHGKKPLAGKRYCMIENCKEPHHAKGTCKKHYNRYYKEEHGR